MKKREVIQEKIFEEEITENTGLKWDEDVPENMWNRVAEYCANDVLATEAVFNARQQDWITRQILADLAGSSLNMTTNSLVLKIVFGDDKSPELVYTDLATGKQSDGNYCPVCFPGYEYIPGPEHKGHGRNMYRGIDLGFGGYVYAEPGIYTDVALIDAASMHPTSIGILNKLGKYTKRYLELKQARVLIKHKNYEAAKKLFDGKLSKYLESEEQAEALSNALKIPLNSFFGIGFASFDNPARDPRDKNDIVALIGALFMKNLQDEVQKRGFKVCHIKTDSIKIPNATNEIIKFVQEYGMEYGYEMEHEATYDRLCLVNDAVYIAKYDDQGIRNKGGKKKYEWTATGTQFQVPYVFKTLFSHEAIEFDDLCEVKEVKTSLYLDYNEDLVDVSEEEKELSKLETKYKKGLLSDTTFESESRILMEKISKGHNIHFVGRVGQFCPIKTGYGGGILLADRGGKYNAVTGTKNYRWLESEVIRNRDDKFDMIDESYYVSLANDAIEAIEKYGSFEAFSSEEIFDGSINPPETEEIFNVPEGTKELVEF